MQDAQVLKLDLIERIDNLPAEALRQVSKFVTSIEAQFVSFHKDKTQEPLSDNILELRGQLIEEYGDGPVPGDTPFIGGVTLDEYYALGDEEQGQLWDRESKIGLIEYEEIEVPRHIIHV